MKKYLQHIHSRPAHERRRFSMRMAASITAAVALVWVVTLGARLGAPQEKTAGSEFIAGAAAASGAFKNQFLQFTSGLQSVNEEPAETQVQAPAPAQTEPAAAPATILTTPEVRY